MTSATPFKWKKISLSILGLTGVGLVGVLYSHQVDNDLTDEDRQSIPVYLNSIKALPPNPAYEEELSFIESIQQKVLEVAPENVGIPNGQKREPAQLLQAKQGLCYDRSRTIEKILRYSGFKTRHVSMFSIAPKSSAMKSLLKRHNPSHAVSEVLTQKGWMVVGSNSGWLSLDKDRNPISMELMQKGASPGPAIAWYKEPSSIYTHPFTYLYGLYSRHGEFYPPYDFIPDVNYGELLQNLSLGR